MHDKYNEDIFLTQEIIGSFIKFTKNFNKNFYMFEVDEIAF